VVKSINQRGHEISQFNSIEARELEKGLEKKKSESNSG